MTLSSPRLRSLARESPARTRPSPETEGAEGRPRGGDTGGTCDLCARPLGPRHGHLVDLRARALRCACRACFLLFDKDGAGGGHYRQVPERVRLLDDFRLRDVDWLALRIPVELAFFFHSSAADRVLALYPGPMGATESLLALDHWEQLEEENPELATLEPDVEALLVNRTRGRREGWLVPVDVCYELVALFRTRWKGLAGGDDVWSAIDEFFDELSARVSVGGPVGR